MAKRFKITNNWENLTYAGPYKASEIMAVQFANGEWVPTYSRRKTGTYQDMWNTYSYETEELYIKYNVYDVELDIPITDKLAVKIIDWEIK